MSIQGFLPGTWPPFSASPSPLWDCQASPGAQTLQAPRDSFQGVFGWKAPPAPLPNTLGIPVIQDPRTPTHELRSEAEATQARPRLPCVRLANLFPSHQCPMECARLPTLLPTSGPSSHLPCWVPLSGTLPTLGPSLRPYSPLLPTLVPSPGSRHCPVGACRPWWLLHGQTLPGQPGLGWRAPVSPLLAAPSFPLSALLASPGGAHIQLPGASLVQNSVTLPKVCPPLCHLQNTLKSMPAQGNSLAV